MKYIVLIIVVLFITAASFAQNAIPGAGMDDGRNSHNQSMQDAGTSYQDGQGTPYMNGAQESTLPAAPLQQNIVSPAYYNGRNTPATAPIPDGNLPADANSHATIYGGGYEPAVNVIQMNGPGGTSANPNPQHK